MALRKGILGRIISRRKGVTPMRKVVLLMVMALLGVSAGYSSPPAADWSINATAIEACSCPHFCMCYFNHLDVRQEPGERNA
jgi:hypothetical protein